MNENANNRPRTPKGLMESLADIYLDVSWLDVANDYFNQPVKWLHEKLKNNDLSPEETEKLRSALFDISGRIRKAAENIPHKD